MRVDANRIALRAIRQILDAAHPLEAEIAGTKVSCTPTRRPRGDWPGAALAGIDAGSDGPWPRTVAVACEWEGGRCSFEVRCRYDTRFRGGEVAIGVFRGTSAQQIVWTNIAYLVHDAGDATTIHVPGHVFIAKRGASEANERLATELRRVVAASQLPLESEARVRLFEVDVATAEVTPSPAVAFRRLVELALLKIDFLSRGEEAIERGRPLIDVAQRTGLSASALAAPPSEEDDDAAPARPRRYWAGGFLWGNESKRDAFIAGNYWQLGATRDAPDAPVKTAWQRFDQIAVGDLFAIKGYGGQHDLKIHYVGEVTSVDGVSGRVGLRKRSVEHYSGKAPKGAGAANWFDTLVPVTRKDVISAIFGGAEESVVATEHHYDDTPLNLILYGPPGTGKTYRLQNQYIDRFTRRAKEVREVDAMAAIAADLSYFEVIVAALDSFAGKKATVDQLLDHPLVKAKYQVNAPKSMRQILWGTLGAHTVDESKTVKTKRRFGELVFDKDHEGRWFLTETLPPELREAVDRVRKPKETPREVRDYDFVTFHQAYNYEDFIEGIRPRVVEADEEDAEGRVGYTLEDGVFKRAVRNALQRTGFSGTIDDFCKLTQEDRAGYFESAPHYAVFIDEINRGNVARVFGELITLLEDDKRLGAENELIVRLPYSGGLFGVPPNLHVIGTMNTADRSVEALDAALRRRFEFEELGPMPHELNFVIDGPIDPRRLLQTINRRLEKLRDRDHCIGHAYFLPLEKEPTLDALKRVFATKIIPLLQEYFFGDWGKIGLVLGREFVRRKQDGVELADFEHDDRDALMARPVYELVPMADLTDVSFRRIYEDVPNAT